jgi:hypothetical protein
VLAVEQYAARRQVARDQRPPAQRIHGGRGALEDARALGWLERRGGEPLSQARVRPRRECDEEAAIPLANGPGPHQIRMVDRSTGRYG